MFYWHRGRSLHVCELEGDEPPIVFLHGLGATHRYWKSRLPPDTFGRRIVLPDLYGFGDSPRPWLRYTMERHLDMLDGVLAGEKRMVLVGHSLGAALALAYAARRPQAVAGLVLISLPHFGDQRSAYAWFRRRPSGWLATNMAVTALTCVLTRWVATWLLPYLVRGYPPDIVKDLARHNMFSSTTSLWNVLYRSDMSTFAHAVPDKMPVVCVHGSDDQTAPIETVRTLAGLRPGWRFGELAATDHHPWLTARTECEAAIREILRRSGAGP